MTQPISEEVQPGWAELAAPATYSRECIRRMHVAELVATLIDPTVESAAKDAALDHLAACDPARAIALLVGMTRSTLNGPNDEADLATGMRRSAAAVRATL